MPGKSQEQENLRKKEINAQDIACKGKHLFWELLVEHIMGGVLGPVP